MCGVCVYVCACVCVCVCMFVCVCVVCVCARARVCVRARVCMKVRGKKMILFFLIFPSLQIIIYNKSYEQLLGDHSGGVVYHVGLRPFVWWDNGFESRWGYGCLSFVSVVNYQVEVSAKG